MSDFKNYKGENIELGLQATKTSDGLISAADKTKLDTMATGANNYAHPTTHPASIIVQDASNRFVTDAEKTTWNAKAPITVVSATANGLMIAADKVKLDGIAAGANAYTHPTTHPASIIVQDVSNRFVTDTEKSTWNAKASTAVATTSANGLMSAADKVLVNNCTYTFGGTAAGYWKKYGDGTLEMWGESVISPALNNYNSTGSIYWSTALTITFPVASTISAVCNIQIEASEPSWSILNHGTNLTSVSYYVMTVGQYKSYSAVVHWHAIGKWK